MNAVKDYDVIIVGGRVAGSIAATLLGSKGHKVLVLDRATFPSDTLSSHFFRAPSFRAFEQIGVLDQVMAVAPQLRVNYNVIDGIIFPEPVEEPEDYPFYMCVRRITLDEILVNQAKSTPNVEFHEGAKVDNLLEEEGKIIGVTWKESNQEMKAHAKVVIGADGVRSLVAKKVNPEVEIEEPINRAMYYAYYKNLEAKEGPAAEFHFRDGNYLAYCVPSDHDLTLVSLSVPISEFSEFKRDPEGKLMDELHAMVGLSPRLDKATREGPIQGTGSIPGYLRIPYGKGWALVGDASMTMDPWSGHGIDHGSTHAGFLAKYLSEYLNKTMDWNKAMQGYHTDRNEFSLKTFKSTCKLSRDITPLTLSALEKRGLKKE